MAWGATRFWEHTGDGGHLAWGCYLGAIGRIPGGCRPVPKGKLRFMGHWEQDVYVCVCVCLWVRVCLCCQVERDWMRLRPRDGMSSSERRAVPRNEARMGPGT